MSKYNNVNPGQYKVGGRLKPGDQTGLEAATKQSVSASRQREAGENTKRKRPPAAGAGEAKARSRSR